MNKAEATETTHSVQLLKIMAITSQTASCILNYKSIKERGHRLNLVQFSSTSPSPPFSSHKKLGKTNIKLSSLSLLSLSLMRSTIFTFLLLSLVFPHYMLHQPLIFVNGDMKLIQETCKNTKYYDLCVSSLKTNATSTKTDTKGLALIMIGVGMANATATSSYLSSQLLSTTVPNDPTMKKVLRECADKYGYAANALQDSVQDLATESYDYAYMHVMGASDYPNACRNAFRRYPGLAYPSELARREDGLKHICDVVLGMIDHLGL